MDHRITTGGAIAIVAVSVVGVLVRIANHRTHETIAKKQADLPAVGAVGTLARAPTNAVLCPVNASRGGFTQWPCGSRGASVAPASTVRVMKATMHGTDAVCRYWVQGGASDNASGDAPCEWFVAQ